MEYKKPALKAEKFSLSGAFLAEELSSLEDDLPGFHDDDNTGPGPGSEIITDIFESIFIID